MALRRIVCLLSLSVLAMASPAVEKNRYRKEMIHYPPDTPFWVTDYFTKGCRVYVDLCPSVYKKQPICGQNYNEEFKNFANYCEMQYENCNSWLNWHVYKRERC
ncbi:uncharacterized protein LOC128680610 [Plodia interpunctella]|uniref:uncharacterized protein LOC128680610 n=1 Tax=Plodia interpunctella TaxID=58824 RepID=UPI002367B2D9|nr:uncharacterized protein LOC128680610 [Plodia interpunctella]